MFGYTGLRTSFKKVQNVGNMVMLQILPSILTPHSLTFLSNFPFEGSRGNDSFLIERRHTHVKDLNMSDMNLNMGEIFLTCVIIHQVCDHTIL